ncbi:hypothetical protein ACGIF2_16855 [Cellulomonas sp. P22]|uniref:hypothetical protein n=1 Tax=Cellulomonas sp. P22 TaxID=3373189 RepID=UPI0037B64880
MTATARHARDRRGLVPSPRGAEGRVAPDVRAAVRPPDPAELVWMEECRRHLRGSDTDLTDVVRLGELVDSYAADWHATPAHLRWDPRPTTRAAGIAVGDLVLGRVPGTTWVVVEATGTLAITHPATSTLELPLTAAAAAWVEGRPRMLPDLVELLVERTLARTGALAEPPRLTGALRLLTLRR